MRTDRSRSSWTCNTICSKRRSRIMPTNVFWKTGGFPSLSVSAILMQLFHRLHALQVGTVPFTRNTYKPWTFIFGNSADPLLALRRTLTGHSNGMKSCTFGTNEQHILFAWRRFRLGPEFVVLHIGNWRLTLPNVPFITGYKEFCIGQRRLGRPKHRWESKLEMYCRYQGLVHWEEATQNYELWEQHLNRFPNFCCQ